MKRHLICLVVGGLIGLTTFAQPNDSRIEKAERAQKKAEDALRLANKTENRRAKLMSLKEKKTALQQTNEEKAQRDKVNLERFRRRLKFLENNIKSNNPASKYKPGPGGAAERIGSPSYRTPSNNMERREARVAQAYPKKNND